jgi:AMMECR1 domain-containing protein
LRKFFFHARQNICKVADLINPKFFLKKKISQSIIILLSVLFIVFFVTKNYVNTGDKAQFVKHAYATIDAFFGLKSESTYKIPEIENYEKIYVTLMHDNKIRCCQSGGAAKDDPARTRLDITQAVEKCINDNRFGGKIKKSEINDLEIIFNVLYNKKQVSGEMDELSKEIELGIHGVEISSNGKSSFFQESVPISKNYSLEKTIERLCVKRKLEKDCNNNPDVKIYKCDTSTFKGDRNGEVVNLYRFNLPLSIDAIDKDYLLERIKLANDWFLNNINKETKTVQYKYYPSKDKYSDSNNHVRQLGSLWSLTAARDFLDVSSSDELIKNSLDKYLNYKICSTDYCYLEIDGDSKLAYNAFLILSLTNAPKYPESEKLAKQFAEGILNLQQKDGSYRTYFNSDKNTGTDYYPGEAMLALMQLYKKTNENKYLDSVNKAFPYYKKYWRDKKNTAFVPWHSQAYALLYEETKNNELAEFIFEMSDWLIENYQIQNSEYTDLIGGFPKIRPRNSTSSYLEGIIDAYKISKLTNDKEHQEKYSDSIKSAIHFVLLTQYTGDNTFYVSNQKRAVGGFRHSLTSNTQRNDYTQHAIHALIKAYGSGIY